jgi:hypothetical protein
MTKPTHPYNRRPQLEGKGHLPIAMNYAMGTGGPAGSELPPVLNGVTCIHCGEHLGKAYRVGPKCSDEKACEGRAKANARFERERLAILEAKEAAQC